MEWWWLSIVRLRSHTFRDRERMTKQMRPNVNNWWTVGVYKSSLNTSCNSFISWELFQNKKLKILKPPTTKHLEVTKSLQWPTGLCTIWPPLSLSHQLLLYSCSLTPLHPPSFLTVLEHTKYILVSEHFYFLRLCLEYFSYRHEHGSLRETQTNHSYKIGTSLPQHYPLPCLTFLHRPYYHLT